MILVSGKFTSFITSQASFLSNFFAAIRSSISLYRFFLWASPGERAENNNFFMFSRGKISESFLILSFLAALLKDRITLRTNTKVSKIFADRNLASLVI